MGGVGTNNKYQIEEEIRDKNRRKRFEVRYDVEKEIRVRPAAMLTAFAAPRTRGRRTGEAERTEQIVAPALLGGKRPRVRHPYEL